MWSVLHSVLLNVFKTTITTANVLIAYVTSERKNTAAKDTASVAGSLSLSLLEMT
jgi:hypothetical protein